MTSKTRHRKSRKPRPAGPEDVVLPGQTDVHDWLLNWGSWCRGGGAGARGRAASAEGRYDSREFITSSGLLRLTDGAAADVVNRALLTLPSQHRSALQLRYVRNLPDRVICRMLDLRAASYARFLADARALLHAALQKQKTPVKVLPHN